MNSILHVTKPINNYYLKTIQFFQNIKMHFVMH